MFLSCAYLHVYSCKKILIHAKSCNCTSDWCKLNRRNRDKGDDDIGENGA